MSELKLKPWWVMVDNFLFKQVCLLDPVAGESQCTDVWWHGGEIKAIGADVRWEQEDGDEPQIIEGQGLILAPALVDLYSSSGEPGYEERETLEQLAAAAQAGGFGQVGILPTTDPPLDNVATINFIHHLSEGLPIKIKPWAAVTIAGAGQMMTNLGELGASQVCGFTDGIPLSDRALMQKILEYAQPLGLPVAFTPIDPKIRQGGTIREGLNSLRYGLPGDPVASETVPLATLVELSANFDTPIHLMRVSTARGVAMVKAAKEEGLAITASTTWLHLLLSTDDVASYDPNLKLSPPLGNKSDREALIDGIKTGVIDAIAIDHQAYTYEENTVAFASAPPGAIGLELALPLLWQNLVTEELLTPIELWQTLTVKPQRCLGQPSAPLKEGSRQDLILFHPHHDWIAQSRNFHSPAINTSWLGKQIRGKVLRYCKGG